MGDELVDIALIVRKQNEILTMFGPRRRIMLDAVERIIRPFRREQRQGKRAAARQNHAAVDDDVIGRDEVWHVKEMLEIFALFGRQRSGRLLKRKGEGMGVVDRPT